MVYAFNIEDKFAPAKITNISILMNVIIPLILAGAALMFLVMTLKAAFDILRNGDSPDALKKAYASIVTSVIGLFIVIFSFVAVRVIGTMLGTKIF